MPEQLADEFRPIPLDQLVEPWVVLRVVNREAVEYLELRDSIAKQGLLNSICVRPSLRRPGYYEVVDGLYRYTAACELRLPALPCIVKQSVSDEEVLALQIQANALRPETTAIEYARQIRRIMDAITARQGRDASLADVSNLIHKSPDWIGATPLAWSRPRYSDGRGAGRDTARLGLCARQVAESPADTICGTGEDGHGAGVHPCRDPSPEADSRGGPAREASRLLQRFRAGAAPAAVEGGARRAQRARSWRLGRRESRQPDAGGRLVFGAPVGAESG